MELPSSACSRHFFQQRIHVVWDLRGKREVVSRASMEGEWHVGGRVWLLGFRGSWAMVPVVDAV